MRYPSIINIVLSISTSLFVISCAEDMVVLSETPIRLEASFPESDKTRTSTEQNEVFDDGETINIYISSGTKRVGGTTEDPTIYCTAVNDGTNVNKLIPNPQPYYQKKVLWIFMPFTRHVLRMMLPHLK